MLCVCPTHLLYVCLRNKRRTYSLSLQALGRGVIDVSWFIRCATVRTFLHREERKACAVSGSGMLLHLHRTFKINIAHQSGSRDRHNRRDRQGHHKAERSTQRGDVSLALSRDLDSVLCVRLSLFLRCLAVSPWAVPACCTVDPRHTQRPQRGYLHNSRRVGQRTNEIVMAGLVPKVSLKTHRTPAVRVASIYLSLSAPGAKLSLCSSFFSPRVRAEERQLDGVPK